MQLLQYQVDAFADAPFKGNPAAVCPLPAWLPDALMQSIANENNLSETAFFVPARGISSCAGSRPRAKSIFAAMPPWRVPTCCFAT